MLKNNENLMDIFYLADLHGFEVDTIRIGFTEVHKIKTKVFKITVKKEIEKEKEINSFMMSCFSRGYTLYTLERSNEYIIIWFYEIKEGENESNK